MSKISEIQYPYLKKQQDAALDILLPKCFQMISGLPSTIIASIQEILRSRTELLSVNFYPLYCDELYPLVRSYDWRWKELDFWSPLFKEMQDAPSLVYETGCCLSSEVTPEFLVSKTTLGYARTVLPVMADIKDEAGFLEYLKTNRYDFEILGRILFMNRELPLGNCYDASQESIFRLFLFTLIMRVWILMKLQRLETLGFSKYSFYQTIFQEEEKWLKISDRPDNPWPYPQQPRIPGLQILLKFDFLDVL